MNLPPVAKRRGRRPGAPNLEFRVIITVNGQQKEIPAGSTVRALIEALGLGGRACAAEVNEQLVPSRRHQEHTLLPDDRVELVTLVGGG